MVSIVTAIREVRAGGRARVVELDSVPWRTTSVAALRTVGLAEGDVIDVEVLAASLDTAEAAALRDRALAVLGYRERSVSELREKLLEDGYPARAVEQTVQAFVRSGLVDDARFADAFVRSASGGKHLGRRRTERELELKGVPDDVATAALDRYMPLDDEESRAQALALRLMRPNERANRLAARLVRKGFSPSLAFAAARDAIRSQASDAETEADDLP